MVVKPALLISVSYIFFTYIALGIFYHLQSNSQYLIFESLKSWFIRRKKYAQKQAQTRESYM